MPGGALDLVQFVRERSRATHVVLLTARKSFDDAVAAFRLGCLDVLFKRPDEIAKLERLMRNAIERHRSSEGSAVQDVTLALDQMAKAIIGLGRSVYAAEIEVLQDGSTASVQVLLVDDDAQFVQDLRAQLAGVEAMDCALELSGGGALDYIGAHACDVIVAPHALSDLPGSIVANVAAQRNPAGVALLYTARGAAGRIDRIADGKTVDSYAPFRSAADLAQRLKELVDEERARRRERRVMQVVGGKHADLFHTYAEARRKLGAK